jgi:hypothetical protein
LTFALSLIGIQVYPSHNCSTLEGIGKEIEELQRKSRRKRVLSYLKDPDKINELRQRLDESIKLFTVHRTSFTSDYTLVLIATVI